MGVGGTKTIEEDQEEGASTSCEQWPRLKLLSLDAAAASVLSELDVISTLKQEQKGD